MKKLYILILLSLLALRTTAQGIINPSYTNLYRIDPGSISVAAEGGAVKFAMQTKYDYGVQPVKLQDDGRVIYSGSDFRPPIVVQPNGEAAPAHVEITDWHEMTPVYTKITESGTQVERVYHSPMVIAQAGQFDMIEFKRNESGSEQKGTVNFYFRDGLRTLWCFLVYTQPSLKKLVAGSIPEWQKIQPGQTSISINLETPFSCGGEQITPQWEYYREHTWIPLKATYPQERYASIQLPEGKSVLVRAKISHDTRTVYSNVCTIVRSEQLGNDNYIRKFSYSGTCMAEDVEYYDGLGYPSRTVSVAASPDAGRHIITPHWYDAQRRDDARSYLPYVSEDASPSAGEMFTRQSSYYTSEYGTEEIYNYAEKVYEPSALNRIVAEYKPGRVFRDADKKIVHKYRLNEPEEVRKLAYDYDTGNISMDGAYPAATLFVQETIDEDGTRLAVYTDRQERKILERSYSDEGQHLDTYYVYDDWGNICRVLPPEYSSRMPVSGVVTEDDDVARKYCFTYRYDGRHRLIEQRLPGREIEYLVYDRNDRPIMTQDGNARKRGQWLLDKYDGQGRFISRQIVASPLDRASLQAKFDERKEAELYNGDGVVRELLYNHYDEDYIIKTGVIEPLAPASLNTQRWGSQPFAAVPGVVSDEDYDKRVKGLLTYTRAALLTPEDTPGARKSVCCHYHYDAKGRVLQTVSENHLGGLSRISYRYDFAGNVLTRHETHQSSPNAVADTLRVEYTYDSRGRVLSEKSYINGVPAADMGFEYDDLGRLSKKIFKSEAQTLTEISSYNLQGWMTSRYGPNLWLGMEYFDPSRSGSQPLYSGNISELRWRPRSTPAGSAADADGEMFISGTEQAYSFHYDPLQRLVGYEHYAGTQQTSEDYVEREIAYDANGNILTLERTAGGQVVDRLCYTYDGNRLVTLDRNGTKYDYEYDANGNCVKDGLNNLQIDYNYLNLLQKVSVNGHVKACYRYSADNTKLSARDAEGYGYDYLGSLVYRTDASGCRMESVSYGGGRIGCSETSEGTAYTMQCFFTDHLGSPRIITDASGTLLESNDYYAFGGRWDSGGAAAQNRWLFNGKESQKDFGFGFLDYGARMFDPVTTRWLTQDIRSADYYSISPYAYCAGNPVKLVDPNGKLIAVWNWTDNTMYYWRNGDQGWGFYSAPLWGGHKYDETDERDYNYTLSELQDALLELMKSSSALELISELSERRDKVMAIELAGRSQHNKEIDKFMYKQNKVENLVGWDMTGGDELIPTTSGGDNSPEVTLAHELAHVLFDWNGGPDRNWFSGMVKGEGERERFTRIKVSEIFTTHIENKIRSELGKPLRTHYTTSDPGVGAGPAIINPRTGTSRFYDINEHTTYKPLKQEDTPYKY